MTWKHIYTIGLVCLLALNNLTFAAQFNWSHGTGDWCDPENWGGTVPAVGDRVLIEAQSLYPVIGVGCYAVCQSLEILPWSWQYAPPDCNVTINGGGLDCNVIRLGGTSTQYNGPGWTPTTATLVVNSGLVTLHNEVPVYDDYNPPAPPGGRGIWIGGGSTTFWANWGHVIINGGALMTPKIALYNGDVTLNGGLLYDTFNSPAEFVIRDMWDRNKIYMSGGTLGLDGDRVTELNNYIAVRRIVGLRAALIGPTYNISDSNTTLSSVFMPGCAWNPSPAKYATDVHFIGGLTLSWSPGDWVATGDPNGHYVFLGTSFNDVNTAGVGTAGTGSPVFIGRRDINNITIAEASIWLNQTYYWRVDEVNDPCNHKGMIWEFKTISAKAYNPVPVDTGTGLKMPLQLSWTASDWSPNEHRVYFGTSLASVQAATTSSGARYRGTVSNPVYPLSKLLEDRGTPAGPDWVLSPDTTYFWRIDERSPTGNYDANSIKAIWSFNTGNSILIDDFQSYFNTDELNDVWLTGVPVPPFGLAGTGRIALVREGASYKYMQFSYDKSGGTPQDPRLYFSEVAYPFSSTTDWTGGGVLALPPNALELMYRGYLSNSADPVYDRMYVAIEDTQGDVSITLNPDPNAQKTGFWAQWDIFYNDLNDQNPNMDINKVSNLYIGFGVRGNVLAGVGGDGNVMFDDIKLQWWGPWCWPPGGPLADFDEDCDVDIFDLDILAEEWLYLCLDCNWPMVEPQDPILWYRFDETDGTSVTDSGTGDANDYTGDVINPISQNWDIDGGRDGNGCIYLPPGQNSYVEIITGGRNPLYFQGTTSGMSFSIWENADMTAYWGWNGIFGTWNDVEESLEIHCPSAWVGNPEGPSCNLIKRNAPGFGDDATVTTGKRPQSNFGGRWNNWIFIKDDSSSPQEIRIYHDGVLVAHADTNDDADIAGPMMLPPISYFRVGTRGGNWGGWIGWLDDFKVWNYALSEEEVHYVATDGGGINCIEIVDCEANIKHSTPEIVNFEDFALLAQEWLTVKLYPYDPW